MCLSMQFLFPNLIIADLYDCMFKILMILIKIATNVCFQILNAVLYYCMFKYVLFVSPDETVERGRNASQ